MPQTLVEIWQANAAGRYRHRVDQHAAPLDPNFSGAGRTITDNEGRYRFVTIRPGAYPWKNHHNAWRPAHIHFSLFGTSFLTRLITQMYFPGDPLLPHDPIFNSIPDERARERLIAGFSLDVTEPEWALGYHLRHRAAWLASHADGGVTWRAVTPFQTVGPFFDFGLEFAGGDIVALRRRGRPRTSSSSGSVRDGAGDPVPDAVIEVWQANAAGRYRHPADDGASAARRRPATDSAVSPQRPRGGSRFSTVDARARARPEWPAGAGAAPARSACSPRRADPARDADVLPGRAGQRRGPGAGAGRRPTGAARSSHAARCRPLTFDIVLQGPGETVFFDV